MTKIAIVIPYFGKFPKWIDLYLYSCSKNPIVDFIFYTDCEIPSRVYPNTIFNKITFSQYCNIVSQALHIQFRPSNSYKLCDIRPFLGIIHKKELDRYDFWGYGDIDLVYGDLSSFLTPQKLLKYDLFTTHINRVAGHFTIIRSKSQYSTLCYKIPNWETLLTDDVHYGINEGSFTEIVMPFKEKLIRCLWNRLFKFFIKDKYRFDKIASLLLPTTNNRVHMREMFTTFQPSPDAIYTYNCKTSTITCGKALNTKTISKGVIYLHFLFFKETKYLKTENYWHEDFYQIPLDTDFSNVTTIEFTTKHIKMA